MASNLKYYIAFYPEYRNSPARDAETHPQRGTDMNRRDAFTTVALAGAAAIATTASVKADTAPESTLERIKKSGVLRVAVIVGQEPYFHKDLASGQWSGACIDMANDIASKLNAKVETLESTWGNQILDLQGGKVDLA